MIMDVADLRRVLDGLEDGLQVVAWDGDDENEEADVLEAFYSPFATQKRGFVIVVSNTKAAELKQRVDELTAEVDGLHEDIRDLEEQLDEAKHRV